MTLSENEYNGLTKIARKTKCDCWFDIRQDKNGNDYVYDLENRKRLSLRTGIVELFEAVIDPPTEYGLTGSEITAVKGLLKEIDYAEIVFRKIKKVTVKKEDLERIIDALICMEDYANDGMIDINNPPEEYEGFADDVKEARECIRLGTEILS